MKIVQINAVCDFGSTGKIVAEISDCLTQNNIENYLAVCTGGKNRDNVYYVGNKLDRKIHALCSRLFGKQGYFSGQATKKLLRHMDKIKPDIVHLHNLHGNYINLPMLFRYLIENKIAVVITLHDCFFFTGKCVYYSIAGCERWKESCGKCPQIESGNGSWFFDRTSQLLADKRMWFKDLSKLAVVGVSDWITNEAKQSILGNADALRTINNGIDLNVFKPKDSDFRQNYNLQNKYVILGVAFGWGRRKGLDVFIKLAESLSDSYQIVLVGTDDSVDKTLPKNIISIPRTRNQIELAEIYTVADVFVNPTREENYPTVNMEALACGVPVLTFKTGGSPEIIGEKCGIIIEQDDFDGLLQGIQKICVDKCFNRDDCVEYAKRFKADDKFKEYIELYKDLL